MEKAERILSQFPWTEMTFDSSSVSVWIQKSQKSINRNSNRVAFILLETQCRAGMVALKSLGAQTPSSPLFHYSLPLALSLMVQDGCWNSTHYRFVGKGVSFLSEILHPTSVHSSRMATLATWKDCTGDWGMQTLSQMRYAQPETHKDPCNKSFKIFS